MTRTVALLSLLALSVVTGCGGGSVSSRRATSDRGSDERTTSARRLIDILGPLGERRSPGQLAEVAAFIRRWELDPMGPAPENPEPADISTPALLMMWLTESPDVHVVITAVLPTLAEGRGADIGPAGMLGTAFGMAAYQIEHPGGDPESPEVQTAGIESALRWYEASLRRGGGHNDLMDELLEIRAHGSLVAWWTAHVTM